MDNWLIGLNSLEAGRQGSWEGERIKDKRKRLKAQGNRTRQNVKEDTGQMLFTAGK